MRGFLRIRGAVATAVTIGGPQWGAEFWRALERVRFDDGSPDLSGDAFEGFDDSATKVATMALRVVKRVAMAPAENAPAENALVVRPCGPAVVDEAVIILGNEQRCASVYQQANGVTQLIVPAWAYASDWVLLPFAA